MIIIAADVTTARLATAIVTAETIGVMIAGTIGVMIAETGVMTAETDATGLGNIKGAAFLAAPLIISIFLIIPIINTLSKII